MGGSKIEVFVVSEIVLNGSFPLFPEATFMIFYLELE